MLSIGSVVIRVTDLDVQLAFWTAALDLEPAYVDVDFALLKPRVGEGPNVSLDAHPSERALPPRIHLDLYADDRSAEVERLVALGARRVEWAKRPADADYVILEDPEGTRFCVVGRD